MGRVDINKVTWDAEADVVVLGSGTGLLAAIEASDLGNKVILLEKADVVGGDTAKSEMNIDASNTKQQKREGIEDCAENHWEWLIREFPWVKDGFDDVNKQWIEKIGPVLDHLEDFGISYKLTTQNSVGDNVKRLHIVEQGKEAWETCILPAALERNVDVRMSTAAKELLTNDAGEVIGVVAQEKDGKCYNVKAKKGIILATGGCNNSEKFVRMYYGADAAAVPGMTLSNTGDGLTMAQEIGADFNGHVMYNYPGVVLKGANVCYPEAVAKGLIWVNNQGKRFTNELNSPFSVYEAYKQPEHKVYMIFSKDVADYMHRLSDNMQADYASGKSFAISLMDKVGEAYLEDFQDKNLLIEAESVEALAEKIHVEPKVLKETIETWNKSVEKGVDEAFGRTMEDKKAGSSTVGYKVVKKLFGDIVPLKNAPFYALESEKVATILMEGPTLVPTADFHVSNVHGQPIPRLYVSGAGLLAGAYTVTPNTGLHHACGFVTAFECARNVNKEQAWD